MKRQHRDEKCRSAPRRITRRIWGDTSGSQVLEFALILPFMVVMLVGVFDFGAAWTLRDKITNGVREGTRLAVRESTLDLSQSQPPSIIAVHDVITSYLSNAGITQCPIDVGPTQAATGLAWNYTSSLPSCGKLLLTIDRGYVDNPPLVVNGSTVIMTRVSLQYPYRFTVFNSAIHLVAADSSYSGNFIINAQSIMQNLN
ncbi:MAG TPA: TadE/TadG family type IV pilus assembly protein [Terriglobales bacterium]|nr:TadE/TadG family type IV pilus assembly protein [Terriglobales bacterium]